MASGVGGIASGYRARIFVSQTCGGESTPLIKTNQGKEQSLVVSSVKVTMIF